jgi:hypothetical protein
VTVKAERGTRQFATGDRIMFLRNERGMGVKNGTLARSSGYRPRAWRCASMTGAVSRSTPRIMPMSIMAMPPPSINRRG